jgi:nicotinate-nucleotide adenylyltransferase
MVRARGDLTGDELGDRREALVAGAVEPGGKARHAPNLVFGVVNEKIGVYGGTFDPVHVGHLVTALDAKVALGLDRMLLVPANAPWQKVGNRRVTPAADRVAMLEAAVEGVDALEVSTVDVDRGGPTYSADTLADLTAAFPDAELFLVVGTDVARELHTWVRVDDVRRLATLVVVDRAGDGGKAEVDQLRLYGWRAEYVPVTALDVSSSEVRCRLAEGRPIDYLVPAGSIRVLRERGLYAHLG